MTTKSPRLSRCMIALAAVALGGLIVGGTVSNKATPIPAIEMAFLADAPKVPIDVAELF